MALGPVRERRSLGLKFLLVCLLAAIMTVPALTSALFIWERSNRAQQVVREVGETFGGEQAFMGPALAAPYELVQTVDGPEGKPVQQIERGWYVVFAETGQVAAKVETESRPRGIFEVRKYDADIRFTAKFDLAGEPSAAPPGAAVDWSRAVLLMGVGDARGAKRAELAVDGQPALTVEPGSAYASILTSLTPDGRQLQWLFAKAPFATPGAAFDAKAHLEFTGVESLSFGLFAKNTDVTVRGEDWPHVGYFGYLAPEKQGALKDGTGFTATWRAPYVARSLAEAGVSGNLGELANLTVTTRFINPANPYQSVTRSLKYAPLFIGVVFLAYFLLEATSERRVHPAQYLLVGLAQVIFYMLLLAIAEQLGFELGFAIAATATVLLIGLYAGAVLRSTVRGAIATFSFAGLYGLIYLLMKLEDFALLVGSVAAFVAIAAVMWATRRLDWYGLTAPTERPPAT